MRDMGVIKDLCFFIHTKKRKMKLESIVWERAGALELGIGTIAHGIRVS